MAQATHTWMLRIAPIVIGGNMLGRQSRSAVRDKLEWLKTDCKRMKSFMQNKYQRETVKLFHVEH